MSHKGRHGSSDDGRSGLFDLGMAFRAHAEEEGSCRWCCRFLGREKSVGVGAYDGDKDGVDNDGDVRRLSRREMSVGVRANDGYNDGDSDVAMVLGFPSFLAPE